MYNLYQTYSGYPNHYQPAAYANVLPQQQIIQVNGKASVDSIQLAPNSSVLLMDTSAPIVWMCVSDGLGKVTSTPYDIVEHKQQEVITLETRIASIESRLSKMEELKNEPDVKKSKSGANVSN